MKAGVGVTRDRREVSSAENDGRIAIERADGAGDLDHRARTRQVVGGEVVPTGYRGSGVTLEALVAVVQRYGRAPVVLDLEREARERAAAGIGRGSEDEPARDDIGDGNVAASNHRQPPVCKRAVRRHRGDLHRQQAVPVRVGEAEIRGLEDVCRILLRRDHDVRTCRSIVDRGHGQRQRRGVRAPVAVGNGVGDHGNGAVVVGCRREAVAAIAAYRQRANAAQSMACRAAGRHRRNRAAHFKARDDARIALGIARVGEKAGRSRYDQGHVLGHRRRFVAVDRGGKQMLVARRTQSARLDRADPLLEVPAAAECGGAGRILGRGDVGARSICQGPQEGGAALASPDIAAVDQDVGVAAERRSNHGEIGGMRRRHALGVQLRAAEAQASLRTVRQDMNRGNALPAGERLRDLVDAVGSRIENHDLDGCRDFAEQGLQVGDIGLDKGDLA